MYKVISAVTFSVICSTADVSADLMKEPPGALKGNRHLQYSSMHEKITDCDQRSNDRWKLKKYPIRLKRYDFKADFHSPFANRGGSSCTTSFNYNFFGNININTRIPTVVDAQIVGTYGKRTRDNDIAEIWWTIATSHAVHNPYSEQSEIVRNTLVNWANENALSKNINVPWGRKPLGYEVIQIVSHIVETVAALGPAISQEERKVIGPWLDGLVRKVQKSTWSSRQDNKQYLVDYTVALWGVVNGDKSAINGLANNYKHAIHDMRNDGSIVQESVRGGTTLQYQGTAVQLLVKQAALIKNVTGVDITTYTAEEKRSLRDAINNLVGAYKNPKAYAKRYAKICPSASFGTIENPEMNWRKFALKPILEYVNYEHKYLGINYPASRVRGRSEYKLAGNIKCMYTE
jgi:hypothetical protein